MKEGVVFVGGAGTASYVPTPAGLDKIFVYMDGHQTQKVIKYTLASNPSASRIYSCLLYTYVISVPFLCGRFKCSFLAFPKLLSINYVVACTVESSSKRAWNPKELLASWLTSPGSVNPQKVATICCNRWFWGGG